MMKFEHTVTYTNIHDAFIWNGYAACLSFDVGRMMNDEVWETIKTYLKERFGHVVSDNMRSVLEQKTRITAFDGGAFIASGNEFDLFVVPHKQGKWRIRSEITKYLMDMAKRYDTIVVKICEDNSKSLRLAKHFGFKEISRDDGMIRLEKQSWVI